MSAGADRTGRDRRGAAPRCATRAGGFTVLELTVSLIVIGLLLGAVSIGKDLQRNAEQQRIFATFVQPWAVAYNEYVARTGVVVGDSETLPTLRVNAGTELLCDAILNPNNGPPGSLDGLMDAVGIEMPPGRAEGREARYVYLDSNGNPQELQICFQNVAWPNGDDVSLNNKNVMVVFGMTPDLARFLDRTIDGRPDARFGQFRQIVPGVVACDPCGSGTVSAIWNRDNTAAFGSVNGSAVDESQIDMVTGFYRMNQ